jgi:hypothetical protein
MSWPARVVGCSVIRRTWSQILWSVGMGAVGVIGGTFTSAEATPITFTASGMSAQPTAISASVTFDVSGSDLVIVLTNTSTSNPGYHNPDLLEGLFFATSTNLSLSPVSATLSSGSTLVDGSIPVGQTLGDQWQYRFSGTGFSNTTVSTSDQYAVGAAGFSGIFSSGNFGSNGQNEDGLGYGIVGTDWNPLTASNGTLNLGPFENNSVTFILSGLPTGFDPYTGILGVTFAYGTGPDSLLNGNCVTCGNDPHPVAEPATIGMFGFGILGLAWSLRGSGRRRLTS